MAGMYAQVILPLSLHDSYTYSVPQQWRSLIRPGQRVVVQFGAKKLYAALVGSLSDKAPEGIEIKDILELLDEEPVVQSVNLEFWKWISAYYCCTLGDVFRAALPPGLKLESKSKITLSDDYPGPELQAHEVEIVNQVTGTDTTLESLQKKLGNKFSFPALKSLLSKKVIRVEEHIGDRYKPKVEAFIRLHPRIKTPEMLQQVLDSLERAKKQQALLLKYCDMSHVFQQSWEKNVPKKKLLEGKEFSAANIKELLVKEVFVQSQKEVSRLTDGKVEQADLNLLNKYQQKALEEITKGFSKEQVVLIHGITASGKTEIYIHLIQETVRQGRQALYLLPEIALTTQIVERLKKVFGKKVGIYHSRLNDHERVEIWNKVLQFKTDKDEGYQIVLGARSSVFMPFSDLGLLVVDEEHENSFKQFDPAPRYHARDMAVVMGKLHHAHVLLGSATPSYESYLNALSDKYKLVRLDKRHSEMELPEIITADIKRAYKKKQMRSVLTPELYSHMEEALKNKEQIVLFQNRRGYSPFVQCFTCGAVPGCRNCDVSLTYHKHRRRLTCHYCGFSLAMPAECPECGSPDIKSRGFGTEKVEEELHELFPDAAIQRMDLDTTRAKNAFGNIIRNVESGKTDILIGTQMVTKGLDFEHVRVVGILNADNLINFPDFRAHERAYQLVSQVSGRAGRKHSRGKVVIQTSQPDHPLIELIKRQDYQTAFNLQMQERKLFRYPPYFRLIKIVVKHKKPDVVDAVADKLAALIRSNKNLYVLGPEYPLVGRIQLWYTKEIWLKLSRSQSPADVKYFVGLCIDKIKKENSSPMIYMDVDPY